MFLSFCRRRVERPRVLGEQLGTSQAGRLRCLMGALGQLAMLRIAGDWAPPDLFKPLPLRGLSDKQAILTLCSTEDHHDARPQ